LPDSIDAVDAFDLYDFVLSPFVHFVWIPNTLNEKWGKVFNIVCRNLLEAISSEGPEGIFSEIRNEKTRIMVERRVVSNLFFFGK